MDAQRVQKVKAAIGRQLDAFGVTLSTALVDSLAEGIVNSFPDREPEPSQILDQTGAIELVGVSRSEWYRLRSAGLLPKPLALPGKHPKWRRADLLVWVEKMRTRAR